MKKLYLLIYAIILITALKAQGQALKPTDIPSKYKNVAAEILKEATKDSSAWKRLAYMCDVYGPRLSGSDNLENAIDWLQAELKKDGFANVKKEPVYVPNWRRNKENCKLISPRAADMNILSFGGSAATPPEGISAEVLVVKGYEDLKEKAALAKGKIVVYNYDFKGYGENAHFRFNGASEAARYGAIACLTRSLSPIGMQNPHTGMMKYNDSLPKIPHAGITAEDAFLLQRLSDYGLKPAVHLYMSADTLPDRLSSNVVGEIKGTLYPEEVIAVGGHIDSWDAGTGAHDDGGGIVATWHAVKLLKDLGYMPKRTIRFVAWANEENGVRGGKAYAQAHKDEKHALLFEFDSGVFDPEVIGFKGPDSLRAYINAIEPLLKTYGDIKVGADSWGVDTGPMARQNNVPMMHIGTKDEGEYFWYHHGPSDTVDKVDPDKLNRCIAAIALSIYIYSELPQINGI